MKAGYLESALNQHCLVTVTDSHGRITDANQPFLNKSGYKLEDILYKSHWIFYTGIEHHDFFEAMWQMVFSGRTWKGEASHLSKNGDIWWADISVIPQMEEGEIVRVVILRTDVTDRKLAEDSASRMATAMDQSLNEIYMFDTESFKFVEVNLGARQNIGYTMDELHKLTAWDIKPNFTEEKYKELAKPLCLDSSKIINFETIHQRKDGSTYPVEVHLQCVGDIFIAMVLDITGRKKSNEESLHAQKMESIGQLTGGIAHDFNNVLGSILGFTQLMQNMMENKDCDEVRMKKYLNNIEVSGTRAKELISHMMAFSRNEIDIANKAEYKVYKLQHLVSDSLELLSSALPSSIVISTNILSQRHILTNNIKLHQLMMNLCINARDAMNGVGYLEIGIRDYVGTPICSSCHKIIEGNYTELYVADDGGGISSEKLNNIFDPFFTTKEVGKGTGMGLSIVHGIMHDHKGHVVVKSGDDGTTFSLLFPEQESPEICTHEENMKEYEAHKGTSKNVLIVDDEVMIGNMVAELLKIKEYNTIYKSDSNDALTYYRHNWKDIDIVVSDQTMPGLTGTAMAKQMYKINPDAKLIICSGNVDNVDITESNGNCAILPKPLNFDDFFQEIDSLLY